LIESNSIQFGNLNKSEKLLFFRPGPWQPAQQPNPPWPMRCFKSAPSLSLFPCRTPLPPLHRAVHQAPPRRTRQPLEPHTPRSTGPSFLLLLHSASDRTPPPQFILSLLWHSSHRAPPCRLLHFTRARSPRRPPDRPPPSTFCLLSILGRRHATTSPHFDQNVAAFLRPVSAAST
jgi:hypothetical protein